MTTAEDMIAYLQKLPPKTQIEVLETYQDGWDHGTRWVPLDLPTPDNSSDTSFFADYNDDVTSARSRYYKKTVLFLGDS